MTSTPDAQLIHMALKGDRLAADTLFQRHRGGVFACLLQALGNADDAHDVTQETLVYALQRLSDLRDPVCFAAWLRGIALSRCVDYRRRRSTRRLGEPMDALNEKSETFDYVERLALRQALETLSDDHRATLLMRYIEGRSLEEIARAQHIPLNTARSRLMAAKRRLRNELPALPARATLAQRISMPTSHFELPPAMQSLLQAAFPGARVLSVHPDPEPWQPFSPRVHIALTHGDERILDFRADLTPNRAALLSVLERFGIPGPRIVYGPVARNGGFLTLCETPRGENLTLWAMGGTPGRIRLATERAIDGMDRLQGATDGLLADPVGAQLPRVTLADEAALLTDDSRWNADPWLAEEGKARYGWLRDPWFSDALSKVTAALRDLHAPLVYTDTFFFYPQTYRIQPTVAEAADEEPLGAPGDPRYQANPLTEIASPFGHFGDPTLGLAMVWVYDCYPFVHTGFVEQILWRRGVSRREFAPRLALKALQMVARDLPVVRPEGAFGYWDGLRGWVDQGLAWM